MGFSVVNVNELEASGPSGAVRFVRRALGVEAFGINWFELPAGAEGHEHDETGSGQEEVCIVVRGGGIWRVDGEEAPVQEGSVIRFDPESTRCPVAGPDGLGFFTIGARRGGYEPRGPF
jgi:quercetin dioxygenase-like cupin family protein